MVMSRRKVEVGNACLVALEVTIAVSIKREKLCSQVSVTTIYLHTMMHRFKLRSQNDRLIHSTELHSDLYLIQVTSVSETDNHSW